MAQKSTSKATFQPVPTSEINRELESLEDNHIAKNINQKEEYVFPRVLPSYLRLQIVSSKLRYSKP